MGRMTEWREAQRQRAGGMVELTTWVPRRAAAYLKDIFARLGDPSERGEDYRNQVVSWSSRRRVVGRTYHGGNFSSEIDLPSIGESWYHRPAGGRVYRAGHDTWIELTPDEAWEIEQLCEGAVSDVLEDWVKKNGLNEKLRDHVGVALDTFFAEKDFEPQPGDSVHRPRNEAEFERNEAEIAQGIREAGLKSRMHPVDDPTIVYYPGIGGVPSRCHAIHRREGDRVLFAMVHVYRGGTSPMNMIHEITRRLHKQFYPEMPFSSIDWFNAWRHNWDSSGRIRISRVIFKEKDGKPSGDVQWKDASDLPAEFEEAIRRAAMPVEPMAGV